MLQTADHPAAAAAATSLEARPPLPPCPPRQVAYIVGMWRQLGDLQKKMLLLSLGLSFLFIFAFSFGVGVDMSAHLGGFLAGLVPPLAPRPLPVEDFLLSSSLADSERRHRWLSEPSRPATVTLRSAAPPRDLQRRRALRTALFVS